MHPGRSYRRLIPFIRPHLWMLLLGLTCTLGFVLTMPALAYLIEWVARSIGAGDLGQLRMLALIGVVFFLVRGAFQYGQDTLMARASLQMVLELRQQIYAHLQALDVDYFSGSRTGDLVYRLTGDLDRVGEVVQRFFHRFIPSVLTILAVVAYLFYLNGILTLTTLLIAPLMGALISWFGDRLLFRSRLNQEKMSDLAALLTEVFAGISLTRAFAAEDYEIRRFSAIAESNRLARFQTEQVKAIQDPVVGFLYAMSVLGVFWVGGWQISQGNLTGSQFLGFIAGVAMLIDPIVHITNNYSELKQGEASVERIFELLNTRSQIRELPGARPMPPIQGWVEFDQVSFAYKPDQPVLKQISFQVSPGEIVALVGSSGAGKSTLVSLIPRFYDPQQGCIRIDGIDIRTVTLKSLRRQIGIVPQEITLFSGTIASNIAYGQEHFDLEAVRQAAQVANIDTFIESLPDGYATRVGERGVTLSGGQRQRLAIARAVLLNPKILILDEATSALDNESEALVQEALQRLMQRCTVFVIAHRLSTVRTAHRIFVLEQGQLLEQGNHRELLGKGGRYAQFHLRQFH
ncbi:MULTISPECIES: ABC transporter ATP-binding protein [unclassified Synechococcus]|uniref:ABC transporter ATP-binding protein n=2 Tax=unclassified Synechococcus TaxID=2626047 RepID=UPI0000695182|nr:ABC transporter, permease/ATP-binding protein [Synechococcus sp. JA-2-3B'a(2-13)]